MARKPQRKDPEIDRDLNAEIDAKKWVPASDAESRKLERIAQRTADALRNGRGGARPGAGRKALGHVTATLNLKKETRAYLQRKAGGSRGMGAVVDWLVAQIRRPAAH